MARTKYKFQPNGSVERWESIDGIFWKMLNVERPFSEVRVNGEPLRFTDVVNVYNGEQECQRM